jgi:coenzyme F420-dependent glucose-6-phosphate dehydrogenase
MVAFGYTLSSEEWGPRDLVAHARRAEAAGFDFLSISDHYHPWIDAQGHSPFVWGVLGALAEATDAVPIGVGVTCPTVRIHPAVVAHAVATADRLLEGRLRFGIGSGEALNEHVLGHRWPPAPVRLAMMEEALEVMRALWTGEEFDHAGDFYRVENARLYDPPDGGHLDVVVSAFGTEAAEVAARIGDGLWNTSPDDEVVAAYAEAGGTGPRYAQLNVCYGPDEDTCRKIVDEVWPNSSFPGTLSQDLPTPAHFGQLASAATTDQRVGSTPCGPAVEPILESVQAYLDAGFDHLYLHQIGPDQDAWFDAWQGEVGEAVRALA